MNFDYSYVQILAILSSHTIDLTFNTSQLSQNTDESSFKDFIKHLLGMREISKFKHIQGRLRSKQNQLAFLRANHNQRSKIYAQINIKIQAKK